MKRIPLYKCTRFFFSIPQCLFVAGTVTTATINIAVQQSLWYVVLEFFGEISRSGITRSHGRWLFFRTSIPISIESALVYISTHSGRFTLIHILTRIFYFLTDILTGVRSNLSAILIWISMIKRLGFLHVFIEQLYVSLFEHYLLF